MNLHYKISSEVHYVKLLVYVGKVITPIEECKNCTLVIENGYVKKLTHGFEYIEGAEIIKCSNCIAIPGFIDMHIHGFRGIDFTKANEKDFIKVSREYIQTGVTTFIPTITSLPHEQLLEVSELIANVASTKDLYASIGGIYFEGPYINPKKAGVQSPEFIRRPDVKEVEELFRTSKGLMKIMALAPEIPNAERVIKKLLSLNVVVAAAHTDSTYEEAMKAFDQGIKLCTHLFNAMRTFHHRDPGIAIAALLRDDIYVEFIADLIHLHKGVISLIFRIKPIDKLIAITDAIHVTGLPDGEYTFSGFRIEVKNGISKVKGTGVLAGSTLTLDTALKNLVFKVGLSLKYCIRSLTLNPAHLLNLEDRGLIKPGYRADVVLLDSKTLDIKAVFVRGTQVLDKL